MGSASNGSPPLNPTHKNKAYRRNYYSDMLRTIDTIILNAAAPFFIRRACRQAVAGRGCPGGAASVDTLLMRQYNYIGLLSVFKGQATLIIVRRNRYK